MTATHAPLCASRCRSTPAKRPIVQRKAKLGATNDALEHEAEAAAKRVISGRSAGVTASATLPTVHRSAPPDAATAGAEAAESAVTSWPGMPLSPSERSYFEPRFGSDLSAVRLHADGPAARAADHIGARAYTVGRHIGFAPGQYRPASLEGRQLIAHELAHTVQQADGIVRRDTVAGDPDIDLGKKLRSEEFNDGYSLAFFDPDFDLIKKPQPMSQALADAFAAREQGIGIKDDRFDATSLVFGKSIRGTKTDGTSRIQDVVPRLAGVIGRALAKVPPTGATAATATPDRIKSLAIFAHGTPSWCSLNVTSSNAPGIFRTIAPFLSKTARIILYTCSSAKGVTENLGSTKEDVYRRGSFERGGTDSLAAVVRDTLVDAGVGNVSVWGHTGAGHPTENWSLRFFTGSAGKGSPGRGFVASFLAIEPVLAGAVAELAAEIGRQGFALDTTSPVFKAQAGRLAADGIYLAYAAMHWDKSLPVKPSEQAPTSSLSTALEAIAHFENVYWPKNVPGLAKMLIKSLGLKKQPAAP
ncbi:eCIS core domain-containing protein [Rhizobium grahamii]|uniref:eCIS core domain-containing protein n=1 Tax=Rhizobium grahamii CCGE 502 TaxID=990285 RepID=S3HU85_9HYPH|nr:DUF4157 domain-containing protein [Rhizobium grahamii]EPE96736.1 hypothetical protein RGCCGE502_18940 [Rhizobium grahamii CCGE 502]